MTLTVLVIGGYGAFGGRLCRLLADEPSVRLLVAGRSLEKAEASCRQKGQAELVPVRVDRDGDVAGQLQALRPDVVVDASGPFQAYGSRPYRVAEAAIAAGADYIDLADGRAFVLGIGALDAAATKAGRFVLAGASTCPVLTIAAARALAEGMDRVDSVTAGIAPSPHAGVGLNVVRAIASYAGQAVPVTRRGEKTTAIGLVDSRRHTITVPGSVPLRRLRFSLVDVPDLELLPEVFPGLQSAWLGAGPTPAVLHGALSFLARVVSWHLLPSLAPAARIMDWCLDHLRWGEHRGGMFVEVTGQAGGNPVVRRWHMIAEGDRGPFVPSLAADIIIRTCLDGRRPRPGARAAHGDVSLAEYQRRFASLGIATARLDGAPSQDAPLYRQLLGTAFGKLSPRLQAGHDVHGRLTLAGGADVERGCGLLARMVGALVGLPPAGTGLRVTVTMTRNGAREGWDRHFGGSRFVTTQELGQGADEGLLVERAGPVSFAMAVVVEGGRLHLVQRGWRLLGAPLPRFLLPNGKAFEHDAGDRFNFDVDVRLPIIGRIAAYRGWLEPVS